MAHCGPLLVTSMNAVIEFAAIGVGGNMDRFRKVMVAVLFVSSTMLVPAVGGAQGADLAATETRLVAGEWLLDGVQTYMGSSGCLKGETYLFSLNPRTVRIKKCVAGQWQSTTSAWSVRQQPPTDVEVVIGATSYIVKFGSDPRAPSMVLRSRTGASITGVTTDRHFRLSED